MYKERIETYLKNNGFGAFDPKAVLFDMDGHKCPLKIREDVYERLIFSLL